MEAFAGFGFTGLFLSSFLAATLLPLSSEVVLALLLSKGFDPYVVLMVATCGNVLGSVVNYVLGAFGSRLILQKWWRMQEAEIRQAEKRFQKFGVLSLLFAWVPVIGDPLTVTAGVLKVHFLLFLILVGLGKFLRYAAVYLAMA